MQDLELFDIVCPDGKKRKHYKANCLECNKEHYFRRRFGKTDGKFCSGGCASKYNNRNRRKEVVCSGCGILFYKKNSSLKNSKSGLYFCNRKCKDNSQKIGGIEKIQPRHYNKTGKPRIYYRQIYKESSGLLICKRCGYNEFESCVHIHHIDKNRENNSLENLIPLCANCHFGLHDNHWKLEDLK